MQEKGVTHGPAEEPNRTLAEKLASISRSNGLLARGWGDPEVLAAARGDGHLWRFIR